MLQFRRFMYKGHVVAKLYKEYRCFAHSPALITNIYSTNLNGTVSMQYPPQEGQLGYWLPMC